MTTYKEIHGGTVQNYTTNPDNPIDGQVWYNKTEQKIKFSFITTAGSWATTNSLNQSREALAAATSAPASTSLVFLGFNNPTKYTQTEKFNGTSWTELNDANTGRANAAGFGVSTAAIAAGGYLGPPGSTAIVESWNGTSWTEVGDLNQHKYTSGGAGTSTAGLVFGGGTTPPYSVLAQTESWNGTSWTEVNDLNTGRTGIGGCGATNTEALAFTGSVSPNAQTETWNGTSWTEVGDLNTGRSGVGSAGIYTSALAVGGNPGFVGNTETWNGSSWTEEGDLNTGRNNLEGGGSTASAVMAGGQAPAISAASEEWTGAGATITRTITDS